MEDAHSTSLYAPAGRGILWIAEWDGTTPPTDPTDYTEIGNCPSFEAEPTVERRPHYSSRSGLRTRDLNPIVQTEYNITFECDELSAKNLSRFFLGTLNTTTGRIAGLQNADKEYALKFVSDNPIGPNATYYFHRVTIGPNGSLQLIGDDYLVMSFTGEGLADVANHASSPYFDIAYQTTTTTTTSTTSTTA